MLPSEVELPSHYPPRLQKELDRCEHEGERLTELGRNHLIRVISDFFYIKVKDPMPAQYTAMASAVVKRFPFLADSLPGVDSHVRVLISMLCRVINILYNIIFVYRHLLRNNLANGLET